MECLVGPLKKGDAKLLNDFRTFFNSPDVRVLAITAAVADRAAMIRIVDVGYRDIRRRRSPRRSLLTGVAPPLLPCNGELLIVGWLWVRSRQNLEGLSHWTVQTFELLF